MNIVAVEALEKQNMHVYVTRYPVDNYQNIYPSKIKIKTTSNTKNIYQSIYAASIPQLNESMITHYPKYPTIQYEVGPKYSPFETRLYDVFTPGNIYLKAMGGDFDGDTTYLKSVFSKEANAEAEKLVYAKTNILGANGIASRGLSKIGREAGVTLYALTKD